MAGTTQLANLTPLQQMKAGKLALRLPQLMVGLSLYGLAMGLFVRAHVGLDPWDVFHQGVSLHTGMSMGLVTILTSFVVLALWVPLRQWPGLGTIANSFWIGIALNITLAVTPTIHGLVWQCVVFAAGLVINGIGGAMYIGSQFGPGPRDGLMTGFHRRTGLSLRLIRTAIEVSVLIFGWLLGGSVGVGTVIYALLIGPLVQFFLPFFTVKLAHPSATGAVESSSAPQLRAAESESSPIHEAEAPADMTAPTRVSAPGVSAEQPKSFVTQRN